MAWPTWLAERPATPQVFRVVVRRVDYYNFVFADDKKWQSYLLESPTGEHMLFGYVQRGSTLEQNFQMSPDVERAFMILKIRFPEAGAAQSGNQVFIDEKVASGWVEKNDDKP